MAPSKRNRAFTLIEVLIVVVIMSVLAGAIIPQFNGATGDAKASALKHGLNVLEGQIAVYRAQHLNCYPTVQDNGLPQLLGATNAQGEIGATGADHPFGPYLIDAPTNPYDGSKKVTAVSLSGQKPTAVVGALGGWQYDETTGAIWPNNPEWFRQ